MYKNFRAMVKQSDFLIYQIITFDFSGSANPCDWYVLTFSLSPLPRVSNELS